MNGQDKGESSNTLEGRKEGREGKECDKLVKGLKRKKKYRDRKNAQ